MAHRPGERTDHTVGVDAPVDTELAATLAALRTPGPRQLTEGRVFARGGMGVISAVEDPLLQRLLARKSLSPQGAAEPSLQAALLREARVMGALDHPGVVPVHEVGLDARGQLCFTMKLVRGVTLADRLGEFAAGAPHERDQLLDLVDVVVKVCDALAYAHARGVVHCDVKASNVIVGGHGEVYLMDWGVARVLAEGDSALPAVFRTTPSAAEETAASLGGSPAHLSPEQARGETGRIGPRTDVFLVGALLYEILARRPVNDAESTAEALVRAARGVLVPPGMVAPDTGIPAEIERITMKALSHDPDDRHPTITALREDLVRFARGGAEFPQVTVAAGEVITRAGEPGDAAYFIVAGHCEVSVVEKGVRTVIRTMGPGDAFGETALLSPGPRTATVTALETMTLEVVSSARFDEAVETMPAWMRRFVLALADRFRERETGTPSQRSG